MESFLQSAATRKLDRLRAEEKMLQHERDTEGAEFADKDKFVTTAYKRQMEEVKKAEEEEKAREGEVAGIVWLGFWLILFPYSGSEKERLSKKGPGMTAFYRSMLDADEEKHAAAMAAASSSSAQPPTQGPSLAIRPPSAAKMEPSAPSKGTYDFADEVEEDPFIRRERQRAEMERAIAVASRPQAPVVEVLPATASTDKEKLEINDEGAVVDKRVLLKAGLNITKKPLATGSTGPGSSNRPEVALPFKSRAVGTDASYEARMARERKRLADQMRDEKERMLSEKRNKEEEEEALARKRRAGGEDGEGEAKRKAARERFEARKKAKMAVEQ